MLPCLALADNLALQRYCKENLGMMVLLERAGRACPSVAGLNQQQAGIGGCHTCWPYEVCTSIVLTPGTAYENSIAILK